jgi:branched-chain amino acid transport system substrate-binding protein
LSAGLVDDHTFNGTSQLVNLATQISTESRYLAQHINSRELDRIAIIHWEDSFSNEFADTLKGWLEKFKIQVVSKIGVSPGSHDYRSILIRLKKIGINAICFNVGQDQQDILLRQLRQLGIDVPIFSNYVYETPSILNLGEIASTVEYSYPLNSAEDTAEKRDFDEKFKKHFGIAARPSANSYFITDGLTLLDLALRRCSSTDPECVGEVFKSTKHFEGLSGKLSFNSDGSNDRPYGIKRVEKGQFAWVRH